MFCPPSVAISTHYAIFINVDAVGRALIRQRPADPARRVSDPTTKTILQSTGVGLGSRYSGAERSGFQEPDCSFTFHITTSFPLD